VHSLSYCWNWRFQLSSLRWWYRRPRKCPKMRPN